MKSGRKLGRNARHRLSLMRNLTWALLTHERITTTVPKAKEARRFVERMVTLAKKNTLHARRLAIARMGGKRTAEINDQPVDLIQKLFTVIAPRYAGRPGGYTRIIKRSYRRLGDGGETCFIEFLKEGETKQQRTRTAPQPKVETQPEPTAPAAPEGETK
jgi:large subunit ribosomal protein L17